MKKLNTPTHTRAFSVLLLFAVIFTQAILPFNVASAAQITTRKLELKASDDGLTGGSKPGGTVNHSFEFVIPTTTAIGAIGFQYCTQPADVGGATCVPPTGLDTSTATLGGSTGVTGLTMVHGPANAFVLSRTTTTFTPGGANLPVTALIKGVVNPTTKNQTFFVRIATYTTFDSLGSPNDTGSVAAATADPIILSGVMPESLVFCTGATVLAPAPSNVPDCSTATAGTIAFNQLFSPTDTATSTSQMAASTNAGFGYAITVNGPTLTSGSNTIAGMTSAPGAAGLANARGTAQFGLNLKANTNAVAASFPGTSADPAPLANATNYKGQPVPGYDTSDLFKFVSGQVVANSENGYVFGTNTAATDAQIYTVSYIANVPGSQPAGTYSTTLTYICTPTY
jgi:hypothetical protein